jgi:anthranilate phosphoribosyltransferase
MTTQEFGAKIQRLIEKKSLSFDETYGMFREVLLNHQPDLQQGAFLAALTAKGETVEEIAGAWAAIDELDTVHFDGEMPGPLCENSGTGMDQLKTFNVSSAAAIIAASCGVAMARHGARAITSSCGTVDLMEAVGVDVDCPVNTVGESIRATGIGLFNGMSPHVHPGALGRILSQIRFGSTLNLAASLANPCRPTLGLRGVHSPHLVEKCAQVMRQIGYRRGLVVHGSDAASGLGMDEISVCGATSICEFTPAGTISYELHPVDFGISPVPAAEIAATGQVDLEARRFISVLKGVGRYSACEDFACLNAGAILYITGQVPEMRRGLDFARQAVASGAAIAKLREWAGCQGVAGGEGLRRFDSLVADCAA